MNPQNCVAFRKYQHRKAFSIKKKWLSKSNQKEPLYENFRLLSALFVLSLTHQAYGQDKQLDMIGWISRASQAPHKKFVPKLSYQTISLKLLGDKTNVPSELMTILSEHAKEIEELSDTFNHKKSKIGGCCVRQKEWLPGYFIKYGIEKT